MHLLKLQGRTQIKAWNTSSWSLETFLSINSHLEKFPVYIKIRKEHFGSSTKGRNCLLKLCKNVKLHQSQNFLKKL